MSREEGRAGRWRVVWNAIFPSGAFPPPAGENHLCSSQRLLNSYHCRFYLLKNVYSIPFTVTARYLLGRFCSNSPVGTTTGNGNWMRSRCQADVGAPGVQRRPRGWWWRRARERPQKFLAKQSGANFPANRAQSDKCWNGFGLWRGWIRSFKPLSADCTDSILAGVIFPPASLQ